MRVGSSSSSRNCIAGPLSGWPRGGTSILSVRKCILELRQRIFRFGRPHQRGSLDSQ